MESKVQPSFYQTQAAFRFTLFPPNGYKVGCIYVEAAPFLSFKEDGKTRIYDWQNNKISFQLSSENIDRFLESYLTGLDVDLIRYSDPNEKYLKLVHTDCRCSATLEIGQRLSEEKPFTKISIKLHSSELLGLDVLLRAAKSRIYGW